MFCSVEHQIVSMEIQTGRIGVTHIQIFPRCSSVLKAIANMDRAYSPKLAQQFLWESFMESGFGERMEFYSQHWDFLHADLASMWRCQQAWSRFCSLADVCPFLSSSAPAKGGLIWQRTIQSCGILLPLLQKLSEIN